MNRFMIAAFVAAVGVAGVTAVSSTSPADAELGFPELVVSKSAAQDITADAQMAASAEQQAALSDGVVSATEYRSAETASITCEANAMARSIGNGATAQVSPPEWSSDRFEVKSSYTIQLGPEHANKTADEISALVPSVTPGASAKACQDKHKTQVEDVYQVQLRSDPAYVDEQAETLRGCLASEGVSVPADATATQTIDKALKSLHAKALDENAEEGAAARVFECLGQVPSMAEIIE